MTFTPIIEYLPEDKKILFAVSIILLMVASIGVGYIFGRSKKRKQENSK